MSFLDATNAKENNFAPLPEGEYLVVSDFAEVKDNSAGTGEIMKVTYRVLLPLEYEGRKVFDNMSIRHTNQMAVEIALSKIKSFLKAAGAKSLKLETVGDYCGYKAIAVIKHREFNGNKQASISYFKAPGVMPVETSESDLPF